LISGFRREVEEICDLLGNYVVYGCDFFPTFRDNLSFPPSGVNVGPRGCPETSLMNYHHKLGNFPEDRSSQE